jgi:dTDP-4-amino-4,6-dideoxygalactose transaminase
MDERIYLSPPHLGGAELGYVQDAFASNWIAPVGPYLDLFEKKLANYVGVGHCTALSSGTAAIHLGLIALGVGQGDEVICSTFTFAGSCNPIMYQGGVPVFVDSELETWNMDPQLLEEAILDRIKKKAKPKAIIVVHLFGMPAKMNEIKKIASRFEIPIIEDAAEGLGSTYEGHKLGSLGDVGIISFNGNKIITTSGGGALLSNNEQIIAKAQFLATQARDVAPFYEHSTVGYNYRLSNICAAIGVGQMEYIGQRVSEKRAIFEGYQQRLSGLGISFQPELSVSVSNRWLVPIILDHTANQSITVHGLKTTLEEKNIESSALWKPMHTQPVFKDCPCYVSGVSEGLFKTGICLPSGTALSGGQLDKISLVVRNYLGYN